MNDDMRHDDIAMIYMILNDTVLHHRLVATTFLRAPKPVKGQKKVKAGRNLEGPATLYYRPVPGTEAPSDAVKEEVRR